MLDVSGFRARFAEFKTISDARIQIALSDAEKRTNPDVFGDSTDEAQGQLAADLLCSSPSGAETRMKDEPDKTVYRINRERLETEHCGFRGGPV
jgi:hypothetical protein